ncbi:ABC transporter substrate-binding protein [Kozakia baliensis]|uniref:ABC transporter substrate-binding protein n=1 Tax=Kozakia baliensis TaxID=153496 RepID=UPI000498302C|nr:ABC transporter substrate-binding protein [Kozakia baliensis]
MNTRHPSVITRRAAILATAATPLAIATRARAHDGTDTQCGSVVSSLPAPAIRKSRRKLTIAWNEAAICNVAVPVAKARGLFDRYGIDVDYVNFAGSTDQLLEALSTGKADGAPGMALRWLKPLQQGFDVKLVAGLHAGCMHLMTTQNSPIHKITDLKGKTVGVTDIGGPDRNFFSIRAKEAGIDPETDISWRQFPADLLPVALQRGAVQAISNGDPFSYLQKHQFNLVEVDSNMNGHWGHTTCCLIGLRGGLVRQEPDIAADVTRAILEAGAWSHCNPEEAGKIFQPYAPKASVADLAAMLRTHDHHLQTTGSTFRNEISQYADALKLVGVFPPSLDTNAYATRVTQDIFRA